MFVPYRYIQLFASMDTVALLLWHLRHLAIFASFYIFANPIYTSIGDREALYSVGLLCLTFVMFCMTLYHFSDPAGVPLHTRDTIHYAFPALAAGAPVMYLADLPLRWLRGRTLLGSSRAVVGNLGFLVCCLSTQYAYCQSTKPERALGVAAFVPNLLGTVVGKGSVYCQMLDEPLQLPLAAAGTLAVLAMWSKLFGLIFRHGMLLVLPVQAAPEPPPGVRKASIVYHDKGRLKEEQMERLLEHRASMSAWYSTNLVHTVGLMFVQFKIFLGRYDVRTMRAALAGVHHSEAAKPVAPFEGQDTLWFDFVADTGDGFNSTYHVARSMAQPTLSVQVPCPRILQRLQQKLSGVMKTATGRILPGGVFAHRRVTSFFQLAEEAVDSMDPTVEFADHPESQGLPLPPHAMSKPVLKRQLSGNFVDSCGAIMSGKTLELKRGQLLLHGGDLAYPHPSLEVYERRLLLPFEAALSAPSGACLVEVAAKTGAAGRESAELAEKNDAPKCWMIPGNHDWFDGLEAFLHCICGRHWFAGWHLPQTNMYWALELPQKWYVFGFDLGLNDDVDDVQYTYFNSMIRNLPADANVISITHGPHWWLDSYMKRESGRMHKHVLSLLGPRLRLLLAGDIHNYSRYSAKTAQGGPELVTSGGGGAFLHPTHLDVEVPGYQRVAVYPAPAISRALALRNPLQFRRRNWAFEILLGTVMVLMVMPALPLCEQTDAVYAAWSTSSAVPVLADLVWRCYVRIFESTTIALIAQLGMAAFMVGFPEAQWGQARRLLWGLPLGLAISLATVGCACGLELAIVTVGIKASSRPAAQSVPAIVSNLAAPWNDLFTWLLPMLIWLVDLPMHVVEARAAVCAVGVESAPRSQYLLYEMLMVPYFWVLATPLAATIFGGYLALASLWGRHVDEAFSSLRVENYKNFLRMHIDDKGSLHLYTLGIAWVARNWQEDDMWRKEEGSERPPARRTAPSRWRPVGGHSPVLVDYVHLPAIRPVNGGAAPGASAAAAAATEEPMAQQDSKHCTIL